MNCDNCGNLFTINGDIYQGYYCCGGHYCSEECLTVMSLNQGETWLEHYEEDGECYYSEWELSELTGE